MWKEGRRGRHRPAEVLFSVCGVCDVCGVNSVYGGAFGVYSVLCGLLCVLAVCACCVCVLCGVLCVRVVCGVQFVFQPCISNWQRRLLVLPSCLCLLSADYPLTRLPNHSTTPLLLPSCTPQCLDARGHKCLRIISDAASARTYTERTACMRLGGTTLRGL